MTTSIELQVISKILTSEDPSTIDELCSYDSSYYSLFKSHVEFIFEHKDKYGSTPDVFTFMAKFPEVSLVDVNEPLEYLVTELRKNKQLILLRETFNKLKDLGSGDVTTAWDYLNNQCELAAQLVESSPMNIIEQAQERSDKVVEYSKQTRIPTGFAEIDKLMYGGLSTVEELLLLVARTNSGKAQPLWSKVLTPKGWVRMGDIKVGDIVVGENNDNGRVVQIFPQGEKEYYRVHFNDGTYAECCDDHLWKVLTCDRRKRAKPNYGEHLVLTTKQLRNTLDLKYSVDISDPIEFQSNFDINNELDGYLLGVIIGDGGLRDGTVTITNESEEIWGRIEGIVEKYNCIRSNNRKAHNSIIGINGTNYVRDKLIEYGLMNKKSVDKFIPKQYFTAPVEVRKALLAGLLDTDGYNTQNKGAVWEFDTASEQLAQDFGELARSLGVFVKIHDRKTSYYIDKSGNKKEGTGSRHITCRSIFNPFWFSKKAERYELRTSPYKHSMPRRHCKMIKNIELIGKTECQCIMLDNNSHTYLTDDYIVTHNTWVLTKMMEAAQKSGFPVLFYSPEMQASYLATRFDTWRGHYQNSELFQGKYTEEYKEYIKHLPESNTSAFIVEDKDMPDGVSVRHLEPFIKKNGIKLLIIDGISYMQDDEKSKSDYDKYQHICLGLFRLSKKYGCAVVITVQANRETKESKDDKGVPFPNIYNIEGSDHPARIATQVFSLRQIFDKHVLDIRLEKTRMANNENPVLSYSWDVNTGNMQYLPGGAEDDPMISMPTTNIINNPREPDNTGLDLGDDDEVEF